MNKNIIAVIGGIFLYLLLWLVMFFLALNYSSPWSWLLTLGLIATLGYFSLKYQKILGIGLLVLTLIFWGYLITNLKQSFCFNYGNNGTMINICEQNFSYRQALWEIFTKNWLPNNEGIPKIFDSEKLSGRQEKLGDIIHQQFDEIWQDVIGEEVVILGHNSTNNNFYFINSFPAPHDLLNDQYIEHKIRLNPMTSLSSDGQLIAYRDKGGLKVRKLMEGKLVAQIDDLNADLSKEPNEIFLLWDNSELKEAMIMNWSWSPDSKKLMLNVGRQPYYLWNLNQLSQANEITTYDLGGDNSEYWYGVGWLPNGLYAAHEIVSSQNMVLRIALINPDNQEVKIVSLNENFPQELNKIYFGGVESLGSENKILIRGINRDFFEEKILEMDNLTDNWGSTSEEEMNQKYGQLEQEIESSWQQWIYDFDQNTLEKIN